MNVNKKWQGLTYIKRVFTPPPSPYQGQDLKLQKSALRCDSGQDNIMLKTHPQITQTDKYLSLQL